MFTNASKPDRWGRWAIPSCQAISLVTKERTEKYSLSKAVATCKWQLYLIINSLTGWVKGFGMNSCYPGMKDRNRDINDLRPEIFPCQMTHVYAGESV